MPPRYAYWTILIDNQPTAFRAREQTELLPTLNQLKRRNADVVMRYFARGRLWDSPEQAQWAAKHVERERRGKDWRPGGAHKDPRAQFKEAERARRQEKRKRHHEAKARVAGAPTSAPPARPRAREGERGPARARRPFGPPRDRSASGGAQKPGFRKPWQNKARQDRHGNRHDDRGDRSAAGKPDRRPNDRKPGQRKPWQDRSRDARGGGRKPWDRDRRPASERPPGIPPASPATERKRPNVPAERRESFAPPRRDVEVKPERPAPPEQIVIKPEPPERG